MPPVYLQNKIHHNTYRAQLGRPENEQTKPRNTTRKGLSGESGSKAGKASGFLPMAAILHIHCRRTWLVGEWLVVKLSNQTVKNQLAI